MKLFPILGIITAGVFLSSVLVATTLIPNPTNTFFACRVFVWTKRAKKKSRLGQGTKIFAFCQEGSLESLNETLIPEINILSGDQTTVCTELDFPPGRYKVECYREMIAQSSVTLIFIDEATLSDSWLFYIMAASYHHGNAIILCYDESINISALPQVVQDLYLVSCVRIPFRIRNQMLLCARHLAASVLSSLEWTNAQELLPFGQIPPVVPDRTPWKYSAYVIHHPEDVRFVSRVKKKKLNAFCSSDIAIGKFLFQGCSEAVHSSETIFIVLTSKLLQNPLFEHQLKLALRCRGHKAIVFVLSKRNNRAVPLLENTALAYAIAVCKKIIL